MDPGSTSIQGVRLDHLVPRTRPTLREVGDLSFLLADPSVVMCQQHGVSSTVSAPKPSKESKPPCGNQIPRVLTQRAPPGCRGRPRIDIWATLSVTALRMTSTSQSSAGRN